MTLDAGRDEDRTELDTFDLLKSELACAFAAPEGGYLQATSLSMRIR